MREIARLVVALAMTFGTASCSGIEFGDAGTTEEDGGPEPEDGGEPEDAGSDAGFDAAVGLDAATPPARDAGIRTDADGGMDAGMDAGMGMDAGTDAGMEMDAGTDAGSDAGCPTAVFGTDVFGGACYAP